MKTLVVTLFSLLLVLGMAVTPSQAAPLGSGEPLLAKDSLNGTIADVDRTGLQVTILTDLGQKESLPVTKVSVLVGLTQGDRVNCEMNDDGKITKIVKTAPIPKGSPAPEPKG